MFLTREYPTPSLSSRQVLVLEVIAFWLMVIDHLGRSGIVAVPGWEIVGRLAFPLFAMTFAYNAIVYGRCNVRKLVILGLLAQPAMSVLFGHHLWQPNVIFAFPLAWLVFRYFADKQSERAIWWKPVVLWSAVVVLSLGPSYDIRGIALIVAMLWLFSANRKNNMLFFGLSCCLFVVATLFGEPHKIAPVIVLLGFVICLVLLLPAGQVHRNRASWWGRAGFGKWYVLHAYVLCAMKLMLVAVVNSA